MSRNELNAEIDETKIDAIFADLGQCQFLGAAVGVVIGSSQSIARTLLGTGFRSVCVGSGGDPEEPASIRFNDFGRIDELVRVKPVWGTNVSVITGRFRSDTTGTEATICDTQEGPRLITVGKFGSMVYDDLKCLADSIWLVRSTNELERWLGGSGILSFDAQGVDLQFLCHPRPTGSDIPAGRLTVDRLAGIVMSPSSHRHLHLRDWSVMWFEEVMTG